MSEGLKQMDLIKGAQMQLQANSNSNSRGLKKFHQIHHLDSEWRIEQIFAAFLFPILVKANESRGNPTRNWNRQLSNGRASSTNQQAAEARKKQPTGFDNGPEEPAMTAAFMRLRKRCVT